MKVECKTCGKKFKGTHGVAVHATRMHRVDSISGAAEVEAPENRKDLVGMTKSFSMSLDHMKAEVKFMEGLLRDIRTTIGQ